MGARPGHPRPTGGDGFRVDGVERLGGASRLLYARLGLTLCAACAPLFDAAPGARLRATRPDRTRPDRTRPDRTRPDRTRPDRPSRRAA